MFEQVKAHYEARLREIEAAGLTKSERVLETPQQTRVRVQG